MSVEGPIIFVEDDADDQFIYREICTKLGVADRLRFFTSGEAVLRYLSETAEDPFIILCDINMPGMDGIELRKRINEDDYLRQKSIPFVFLSTAATPDQVAVAYKMTVQGFFLKQHSFAETLSTFRMIVDYWKTCKHPPAPKRSKRV